MRMPLLLADFTHARDCKLNLRKNVDTTNADRLERSGIGEFIGRSVADAENIYLSYLGCLRCHSQGAIEIYLASNRY